MKETELAWTGERLVTSIFSYGAIDHLHRYALAIQLVKDKNVLDIASGEGYGSFLLAKIAKSVIGVDISAEAVMHASDKYKNANLKFVQGPADNIPLTDKTIDVVISFETIEHHDKHVEMIEEVRRVLKDDGILLISSPDKLNYSEIPAISNPFHIKELYREEFKALLRNHFNNTIFLNQKSVYGSLIIPEEKSSSYQEFIGDYSQILSHTEMQSPVYNLCIASDSSINYFAMSFFCGKNSTDYPDTNEIGQLRNQLESIKKTTAYRLVLLINSIIRPIRNFIKKR